MYALLAINGNSPDVRVIAVNPSKNALKQFISKPHTYWWWTDAGPSIETPNLTWRCQVGTQYEKDYETEEAIFYGRLFDRAVTKLVIKKVELKTL